MAVSDRICVMNAGRMEQVATPFELYHRPDDPVRRRLRGRDELPARAGGGGDAHGRAGPLPGGRGPRRGGGSGHPPAGSGAAASPRSRACGCPAILRKVTFLGHEIHCVLDSEAGRLAYHTRTSSPDLLGREGRAVDACCPLAHMTLFGADGRRIVAELAA